MKKNIVSITITKVKSDKEGYRFLVETKIRNKIQEKNIFISLDNALTDIKEQFTNHILKVEEI